MRHACMFDMYMYVWHAPETAAPRPWENFSPDGFKQALS
jgi:hypothetical protein